MKDSKTIRNEHQSFVDAWKKIQEDNSSTPVEEGYRKVKDMLKTNKKGYKVEKVLVRKSGAFTALAEKYNMSPKQFGRYVEANQHLFDIPTRKKAILANKFQGFKETKEWDEFFGDLELVESKAPYVVHEADRKGNTPAWQGYVEGKINEITGQPLYVAGEDVQNEGVGAALVGGALATGLAIKGMQTMNKMKNDAKKRDPNTNAGKIQSATDAKNKALQNMSHELEGEDLQEITTKDTKSGTKFKVRVKDKKTNSSYIRFATRDKIAQLRSDPKIASVEMTDEGQTPEERGEKKAQAAGGGDQKKAKKDYDGDGKVETGSQEYLGSRDKAIKKAMKKRSVTTEAQSNWREDLKEIMGEVEKTEGKKSKSKKKNGICINPDTDDEKNKYEEVKPMTSVTGDGSKLSPRHTPGGDLSQYNKDGTKKTPSMNKKRGTAFIKAQEAAESLGAELQSLKIEDADGNVAYEVVDLVKPDPMKENVMLTYKSGQGFDAKLGGTSVRNTVNNIKTGVNVVKDIKNTGLKNTYNKYTSGNKNTNTKPTVSSNIDSAIKNYKSTISSSYEMETEDVQQTVTNILDKGSNFMKNTKVGRVLGKVFGPSNPKNKGSDYTKDGKIAR